MFDRNINPLAAQIGQGIMGQGMQGMSQARSPIMSLVAALQQGLGGMVIGGQKKAENRERSAITDAMMGYQDMTRKSEPLKGDIVRGMAESMAGGELPEDQKMWMETGEEFAKRKAGSKKELISMMMESQLPEFRKQGMTMAFAEMAPAGYEYKVVNNKLFSINQKTNEIKEVADASNEMDNWLKAEEGQWFMRPDPETGEPTPYQPIPEPNRDWESGFAVNENGDMMKWDNNLNDGEGGFVDTGQKAQKPASLVKLDQRINLSPEEEAKILTTGAKTKLQTEAFENARLLNDMNSYYEQGLAMTEEEVNNLFTIPGKAKMWIYELREKFGADLSDKEIAALSTKAGFQAKIWMMTNEYIHKITGAQVSEHEVNRLMNAIANPDDSYTVFMAKLKAATDIAASANRAYEQALQGEGVTAKSAKDMASSVFNTNAEYYINMDDQGWSRQGLAQQRAARMSQQSQPQQQNNDGRVFSEPPPDTGLE